MQLGATVQKKKNRGEFLLVSSNTKARVGKRNMKPREVRMWGISSRTGGHWPIA